MDTNTACSGGKGDCGKGKGGKTSALGATEPADATVSLGANDSDSSIPDPMAINQPLDAEMMNSETACSGKGCGKGGKGSRRTQEITGANTRSGIRGGRRLR